MQEKRIEDRRMFERIPAKFSVGYLDLSSRTSNRAETFDISANGIGIVTNKELPADASLDVWVDIPNSSEPLHVRGDVTWSKMVEPNKYKVGVLLDTIKLMEMSRILRAMNYSCS